MTPDEYVYLDVTFCRRQSDHALMVVNMSEARQRSVFTCIREVIQASEAAVVFDECSVRDCATILSLAGASQRPALCHGDICYAPVALRARTLFFTMNDALYL